MLMQGRMPKPSEISGFSPINFNNNVMYRYYRLKSIKNLITASEYSCKTGF